jgi:protein-tyrosine phosphatase
MRQSALVKCWIKVEGKIKLNQVKIVRVLFVCLGNICRSPMAEAVFRHLVKSAGLTHQIDVESAGTGDWHAGEPPHKGTVTILKRNQIEIGGKRARQISRTDLDEFDYIIAMDNENVRELYVMFGRQVPRLLEFAAQASILDVPDPYYDGNFDEVFRLVQSGCAGLLAFIRQQEGL